MEIEFLVVYQRSMCQPFSIFIHLNPISWLSELQFFEIFLCGPNGEKAPGLIFSGVSNKKRLGKGLKISNLELHKSELITKN